MKLQRTYEVRRSGQKAPGACQVAVKPMAPQPILGNPKPYAETTKSKLQPILGFRVQGLASTLKPSTLYPALGGFRHQPLVLGPRSGTYLLGCLLGPYGKWLGLKVLLVRSVCNYGAFLGGLMLRQANLCCQRRSLGSNCQRATEKTETSQLRDAPMLDCLHLTSSKRDIHTSTENNNDSAIHTHTSDLEHPMFHHVSAKGRRTTTTASGVVGTLHPRDLC